MALSDLLITLQKYGVIDLIIPFMLMFSLIYAVLLKTKMFGDPATDKQAKKIYTIIALGFGVMSIIPSFIPIEGVPNLVNIMKSSFPQVSVLLLVVLSIFLILGMFGTTISTEDNPILQTILIFLIGFVVVIFLRGADVLNANTPIIGQLLFGTGNQDLWNLIVALAVFGLVIWFVTKEDKKAGDKGTFGENLSKLFKPLK